MSFNISCLVTIDTFQLLNSDIRLMGILRDSTENQFSPKVLLDGSGLDR